MLHDFVPLGVISVVNFEPRALQISRELTLVILNRNMINGVWT